jgi:hypothetical protein
MRWNLRVGWRLGPNAMKPSNWQARFVVQPRSEAWCLPNAAGPASSSPQVTGQGIVGTYRPRRKRALQCGKRKMSSKPGVLLDTKIYFSRFRERPRLTRCRRQTKRSHDRFLRTVTGPTDSERMGDAPTTPWKRHRRSSDFRENQSMIRKSGSRFSLATNAERVCAEIMLQQRVKTMMRYIAS